MRNKARVDSNQTEIVATFKAMGCTVQHLHTVGKGCPDIIIGRNNANYLIEIKDGAKKPSEQKLTKDEVLWHEAWRGQVIIISSKEEAINLINSLVK